jgi:hypothetical protein
MVAMIMADDDVRCSSQRFRDSTSGSFRGYNLNWVRQEAMSPEAKGDPGVNNYFAVIYVNDTT